MKSSILFRRPTLLLLAAGMLGCASAADYQWDVNGATAGLGGTGSRNSANTVWDDLSAGVNDGTDTTQAVTFATSHTATFAGTAGTVTLTSGAYSGDTNVTAGTLSIVERYLDDTSSVSIGATGVLDLSFSGIGDTDTVAKLFINGVQQTTGTWGSTASGATHPDDTHFTGTGTLTVTTAPDPLIVVASPVVETTHSAATALSIPVSNNGATQTLILSAITIGGANAASFVVNSTLPINIAPGGSSTIDYTFTPTTGPGAYTATFDITSNDLALSPKTVTLNFTDNPDPWIVASNASFTNNGVAANYTVSISNTGNANTLTLGTVTAGGIAASAVTGITAPTSVLPGQSGDIQVTFTPGSGFGRFNGTLQIASNDYNGTTPNITLTAFVEPSGAVAARFDFAPNSVSGTVLDISYTIETSPDLLSPWTPVSYVLPDVNNGTTISYALPTGLGKIFARLVVTQKP